MENIILLLIRKSRLRDLFKVKQKAIGRARNLSFLVWNHQQKVKNLECVPKDYLFYNAFTVISFYYCLSI